VAALLAWLLWDDPLPQPGWLDAEAVRRALLATLPLAVAVGLMTSAQGQHVPAFRNLNRAVERAVGPALRDLDLAGLAALAAAAGVAEELLFRGVLQELWGLWPATLLFGLAHALTPTYFLLASAMGWYLGWLFVDTGNLVVPILVHALYDLWALWLVRRQLRADATLRAARELSERGAAARRKREPAARAAGDSEPSLPEKKGVPGPSTEAPTDPSRGDVGSPDGVEAPADDPMDRQP